MSSLFALSGCAATTGTLDSLGNLKDKALEATGLKTPEASMPDVALPARRISLSLAASQSLNVNDDGQSLALLVRVYKLKNAEAFLSAPYEAFGSAEAEKQRLGEDLIEVREIQLVPGQHVDVTEKVAREAGYLGVVALYRSPAPQRWKLAFSADAAQLTGVSLAAHACALSVTRGRPYGVPASNLPGLGACHSGGN
ncbi:type VI secretion system lipoprotein TssJ [Aquabacterium sp.]|uniref:type VI secretion system lipoprotein TssJ n=1 Tax=Aquabacterium sp. TaxID=1872578 RepID=UPI0035AEF416